MVTYHTHINREKHVRTRSIRVHTEHMCICIYIPVYICYAYLQTVTHIYRNTNGLCIFRKIPAYDQYMQELNIKCTYVLHSVREQNFVLFQFESNMAICIGSKRNFPWFIIKWKLLTQHISNWLTIALIRNCSYATQNDFLQPLSNKKTYRLLLELPLRMMHKPSPDLFIDYCATMQNIEEQLRGIFTADIY